MYTVNIETMIMILNGVYPKDDIIKRKPIERIIAQMWREIAKSNKSHNNKLNLGVASAVVLMRKR